MSPQVYLFHKSVIKVVHIILRGAPFKRIEELLEPSKTRDDYIVIKHDNSIQTDI